MICPDCGELVNLISTDEITCECGWVGTYSTWEVAIEAKAKGMGLKQEKNFFDNKIEW